MKISENEILIHISKYICEEIDFWELIWRLWRSQI